jgi:hypothetical protein
VLAKLFLLCTRTSWELWVGEDVRRTTELAKLRLMMGETAARRAAAMAERWRNMAAAMGGSGLRSEVGLTFEMEMDVPEIKPWYVKPQAIRHSTRV